MSDDDDESAQLGQRETDSLSGDYLSTEDLGSAVLDSSEDQLEMRALMPITNSNSREDEDTNWETPTILTPDNSGAIPPISTQQSDLERDQVMADGKASLPSSLEVMYPTSLMEDTDFTIEKVLGETTANILMEAEVAASRFANEFKELEASFDSDMDVAGPHSILTCRICQLFVRTVDRLLDRPDELRDHYLPLTEEEIANLKKAAVEIDDPVADHQVQACLDRINNLASKLRQRAYMKALSKLRLARRNTQESLCQLHQTINLIGEVQNEQQPQYHQSFRKLSAITVEWTQRRPRQSLPPPFEELKEPASRDEGVGPPVAESTPLSVGPPVAESTPLSAGPPVVESTPLSVGPPVAESTQISVGPPVAESTRVDDLGPPLAQSSGIEQTVEFSRAGETEPPSLEISGMELTAGPEAIPEKALPPPAERSHEEKTRTPPPPEISCTDDVSMPPLEISLPEEDAKPATGVPEHVRWDTANITVTSPACDKQEQLGFGAPPAEDEIEILPSEVEAKALEMSRSLAHNLRGTYENLLAHLKDLPEDLRQKLCQTCRDMAALGSDFDAAHSFGDLPRGLLKKTFEVMGEAQGSMDELMEYALQSPKALLWLKDHLSNLEEPEPEQVVREDIPVPAEGEEEGVSLPGKIEENRDLVRLQGAYDPKGCKEDERPGEQGLEVPPAGEGQSEDILEVQRAYDPQGCKEEAVRETEEQEGQPGGQPAWNFVEMLQGYLPKAREEEEEESRREVEEVQQVEEEAVAERNILEIQEAQDPKGCDDEGVPPGESEVVPPSSEWELEGLLQIQEAYDPKDCQEGPPPRRQGDEEAGTPLEWNVMKFLQAYAPKMPTKEEPSPEKKDEVVVAPIQEAANDPESSEREEAHDPKTSTSGLRPARNLVGIQQAYDPQGCVEDTRWGKEEKTEEVLPPSERAGEEILKLQQAYDPQGCTDDLVPVRETSEVSASAKPEWNFFKMLQSYIPRSRSPGVSPAAEAPPPAPPAGREDDLNPHDRKETVPPPRKQEPPRWDILRIQEDQDPKGCKEEAS